MAEINCPKCYLAMPFIPDLAGKPVLCPECRCRFTMTDNTIPPVAEHYAPPPLHRAYVHPYQQSSVRTKRTLARPSNHSCDTRLLLGLTFGAISALAGCIGFLMASYFGVGWWALVSGAFSVAGLLFTITSKWRIESIFAIVLSLIGASLSIYLIAAGLRIGSELRQHRLSQLQHLTRRDNRLS